MLVPPWDLWGFLGKPVLLAQASLNSGGYLDAVCGYDDGCCVLNLPMLWVVRVQSDSGRALIQVLSLHLHQLSGVHS